MTIRLKNANCGCPPCGTVTECTSWNWVDLPWDRYEVQATGVWSACRAGYPGPLFLTEPLLLQAAITLPICTPGAITMHPLGVGGALEGTLSFDVLPRSVVVTADVRVSTTWGFDPFGESWNHVAVQLDASICGGPPWCELYGCGFPVVALSVQMSGESTAIGCPTGLRKWRGQWALAMYVSCND